MKRKLGLKEISDLIIKSLSDRVLGAADSGVNRIYNRQYILPMVKYCVEDDYIVDGVFPNIFDEKKHEDLHIYFIYGEGNSNGAIHMTCNPYTGEEIYLVFPDSIPTSCNTIDDTSFVEIMNIYKGLSSYYNILPFSKSSKVFRKQLILLSIGSLHFIKEELRVKVEKFNHYAYYPYNKVFDFIEDKGYDEFVKQASESTSMLSWFSSEAVEVQ